jgi:hypothetical protein
MVEELEEEVQGGLYVLVALEGLDGLGRDCERHIGACGVTVIHVGWREHVDIHICIVDAGIGHVGIGIEHVVIGEATIDAGIGQVTIEHVANGDVTIAVGIGQAVIEHVIADVRVEHIAVGHGGTEHVGITHVGTVHVVIGQVLTVIAVEHVGYVEGIPMVVQLLERIGSSGVYGLIGRLH